MSATKGKLDIATALLEYHALFYRVSRHNNFCHEDACFLYENFPGLLKTGVLWSREADHDELLQNLNWEPVADEPEPEPEPKATEYSKSWVEVKRIIKKNFDELIEGIESNPHIIILEDSGLKPEPIQEAKAYHKEAELSERIKKLIHEYDNELSLVAAIGILDIAKDEIKEGHNNENKG